MERRAKERLIGASILVVLVVLIVPELLSGPKPAAPPSAPLLPAPSTNAPEPTRTVTLDLATSKSTSADTEGDPTDSAVSSGAPAASSTDAAPSTPPVARSVVDPKPLNDVPPIAPSRPVDAPAPVATSSGRWSVQLGSFANRANAENLVRQLKSQGFQVYDSAIGAGQAQRFRVRVGPLSDRAAADRTIAKLKALGRAASVVPPSR